MIQSRTKPSSIGYSTFHILQLPYWHLYQLCDDKSQKPLGK